LQILTSLNSKGTAAKDLPSTMFLPGGMFLPGAMFLPCAMFLPGAMFLQGAIFLYIFLHSYFVCANNLLAQIFWVYLG
jgi:hypothetical protein